MAGAPDRRRWRHHVTGPLVAELHHVTHPGYARRRRCPLVGNESRPHVSNDADNHRDAADGVAAVTGRSRRTGRPPAPGDRGGQRLVFSTVNNGVYKAGAGRYPGAVPGGLRRAVHHAGRAGGWRPVRVLLGGEPTEADIRPYPMLAGFDVVTTSIQADRRCFADHQSLWGTPGICSAGGVRPRLRRDQRTTTSQSRDGPSRIVPKGPFVSGLAARRDRLRGRSRRWVRLRPGRRQEERGGK